MQVFGTPLSARRGGDHGFTLIEVIIAITLTAITMTAAALTLNGSLRVFGSAHQRSVYVELTNKELEKLRSFPYENVGVHGTDPDLASAYPAGRYEGRDAVTVTAAAALVPDAVEVVTTAPVANARVPFTIRRWVTWTDSTGGATHHFKLLKVRLEWTESTGAGRSFEAETKLYPGGEGRGGTNLPPTATASASPADTTPGTDVTFSATASDPEGGALTYEWDFGDSTTGAGASATHAYASGGTYTAQVTVTDPDGATAVTSVAILVRSVNGAPVVSFTRTPSGSGQAPLSVTVDASATTDPEGDPISFTWSWGDGTADGVGVSASHVYAAEGIYALTLTATDSLGNAGTANDSITVLTAVCDITSAELTNPIGASPANEIVVRSSYKPVDPTIRFEAVTTSACDAVTASIATTTGVLDVDLVLVGTSSGALRWRRDLDVGTSARFSTGCRQSSTVDAADTDITAPTETSRSFVYAVRKEGKTCDVA